ncbi:PREDICTED: gasdermin-A [Charadrius vociferus]|uniref:gasdermin-A n=1 Tax=Charadrius vociferus TaxID=50402 RepID=UPI000521B038|nr:PREDICTED: gasdermin-A [Charadrius vociferus]
MFQRVTQSIVNQVDSGDLVPVRSILDNQHFRPLCLVTEQRRFVFFGSRRYMQTFYRFDEVLLPAGDDKSTESLFPKGGHQDSMQFSVKKHVSDNVDGSASACVEPASAEVKGAASLSKEWSVKLQHNHISVPELEALIPERKINMDHPFIKQLQKKPQRLYIVRETIETLEDTIYEESTEGGGSLKIQAYATLCAKGTRKNKQSITIPKGCTLAFKVIPLTITDGSWFLGHFTSRAMFESDGLSEGRLGQLKVEFKANCQILSKLSPDMSIILLKAIKAVMRDRNLFQELAQKMEAVLDETDSCELKTESPDLKDLLNTLRYSKQLLRQMARAIAYTLDVLDELMEDQLLLLLESLEEKIMHQQLMLVTSILEHDIEQKKGNFRVDARLLSFSQEKQQELTIAMVEMSGVTFQKDGSFVCTENAFSAVAALCVSLHILSLLSN